MAARKKTETKKSKKAENASDPGHDGDEALSFESALERLEGLVDRLEGGDLELEESLGVFEQGVALSKQCASKLESAERKVEQLVREGGEWLTRPFEDATGDPSYEREGDYEER
jgi:exodeoxyribonuclease VII small subunit